METEEKNVHCENRLSDVIQIFPEFFQNLAIRNSESVTGLNSGLSLLSVMDYPRDYPYHGTLQCIRPFSAWASPGDFERLRRQKFK